MKRAGATQRTQQLVKVDGKKKGGVGGVGREKL